MFLAVLLKLRLGPTFVNKKGCEEFLSLAEKLWTEASARAAVADELTDAIVKEHMEPPRPHGLIIAHVVFELPCCGSAMDCNNVVRVRSRNSLNCCQRLLSVSKADSASWSH